MRTRSKRVIGDEGRQTRADCVDYLKTKKTEGSRERGKTAQWVDRIGIDGERLGNRGEAGDDE